VPTDRDAVDASPSGLDLLVAMAHHHHGDGPLTSSRLAALTGRDRGLVARVVDDLVELGLVERNPSDRSLHLGWGLYTAAAQVVERRIITRGQPLLDQLALECGESAYLVRRRGAQSVTLAEAMPHVSVRGMSWLGRSVPVTRGDAGPVLLLDLSATELRSLLGSGPLPATSGARAPRTREAFEREIARARTDGFCVLIEQTEAGVASVGAPVRDFRSRLAGAVVVVGPSDRIEPRSIAITAAVRAAAAQLSSDLGWRT
jgi:DNA-binding IclR family transcriptional regulator